jgi:hypothetical protein
MNFRYFSVIGIVSSLILLGGCKPERALDPGLAALDEAIGSLETQSADWQQIVARLGDRLPEDAKAIVRQVEEASRNVIATGGVEMRCNVDFFGRRLKESLQRLRNSIEPFYDLPPRLPVLCQISPDVITLTADRRLDLPAGATVVRMFGYNLDVQDRRMLLMSTTGSQQRDLTGCLDASTTYQMTLNLGTNACLTDIQAADVTWRHVKLEGFSEEAQSPRTLPITYTPPRACRSRTVNIEPSTVSLSGLSNRSGDKDFWNNIRYTVSARLQQQPQSVGVRVEMQAEELGGDRTEFRGSAMRTLNLAVPQDHIVTAIETPRSASKTNTVDTHTETDVVPDTGLVNRWTVRLNKHGDDDRFIGADVKLNRVTVRIAEDPARVTCTP